MCAVVSGLLRIGESAKETNGDKLVPAGAIRPQMNPLYTTEISSAAQRQVPPHAYLSIYTFTLSHLPCSTGGKKALLKFNYIGDACA